MLISVIAPAPTFEPSSAAKSAGIVVNATSRLTVESGKNMDLDPLALKIVPARVEPSPPISAKEAVPAVVSNFRVKSFVISSSGPISLNTVILLVLAETSD